MVPVSQIIDELVFYIERCINAIIGNVFKGGLRFGRGEYTDSLDLYSHDSISSNDIYFLRWSHIHNGQRKKVPTKTYLNFGLYYRRKGVIT
jgi:hypothetical protein